MANTTRANGRGQNKKADCCILAQPGTRGSATQVPSPANVSHPKSVERLPANLGKSNLLPCSKTNQPPRTRSHLAHRQARTTAHVTATSRATTMGGGGRRGSQRQNRRERRGRGACTRQGTIITSIDAREMKRCGEGQKYTDARACIIARDRPSNQTGPGTAQPGQRRKQQGCCPRACISSHQPRPRRR